jgi:hypothetical protein
MPTMNFAAASGEWNTAANWNLVGEETTHRVPLSTDDTTFTGIDGSAALTITTTIAVAKSVDFSTAGAIFTLSGSVELRVAGSVICKTGMTWAQSGRFRAGWTSTGTLTSNGVSLASIADFVSNSGGLTLSDEMNIGTKPLYIYTNSYLISNDNTITCGSLGDAGSAGAVTLTLGTSILNVSNISFSAATLTVTANTAAINITSTADITANFGGKTWGGTTTVLMTGGKQFYLNGANTFGNFAISWTTDSLLSNIRLGDNQICVSEFKLTGSSTVLRPIIDTHATGHPQTITAATVTMIGAVCGVDFRDIVGAGDGSWNLSSIASGNLGGNSGITFRTADEYYLDSGTSDSNLTSNVWATSSGGGPGGTGVFPLTQDTIFIDDASWDDTGNTFTIGTSHRVGNINASGLSEANTLAISNAVFYGDLILTGSGLTVTSTGATLPSIDARLKNEASDTLDINCGSAIGSGAVTIDSYGGTVRLLTNNLTHTGNFTLTRGTFDVNGKTLSTNTYNQSNSNTRVLQSSAAGGKIVTKALTGTVFNTDTPTGLTVKSSDDAGFYDIAVDIGTSNLTQSADVTFSGGGKKYGDFKVTKHAGNFDCKVTGANTLGIVTLETPDGTYAYSGIAGTTGQAITSLAADGTATEKITIQIPLVDTAGTNTVTNCTITNSAVSGGAKWLALLSAGNTNVSGNTGWTWTQFIQSVMRHRFIPPFLGG